MSFLCFLSFVRSLVRWFWCRCGRVRGEERGEGARRCEGVRVCVADGGRVGFGVAAVAGVRDR